jgi:hypothetical protein
MKIRDKNYSKLRELREAQETKELTLNPKVVSSSGPPEGNSRRVSIINGKAMESVHAALYEVGMQQKRQQQQRVIKKQEDVRRKELEDGELAFKPKISERSASLAKKRRSRQFRGAAVSAAPVVQVPESAVQSQSQTPTVKREIARMSIRIGESGEVDLVILEDSNPEQLARSFVQSHGLPERAQSALVGKITELTAAASSADLRSSQQRAAAGSVQPPADQQDSDRKEPRSEAHSASPTRQRTREQRNHHEEDVTSPPQKRCVSADLTARRPKRLTIFDHLYDQVSQNIAAGIVSLCHQHLI